MARKGGEAVVVDQTPSQTRLAALLEKHKDFDGIKVIERRLKNPEHDPGSIDIRLKDEPDYVSDPHGKKRKWYLRFINASQEGRFSIVTDVKGYVPVKVVELQNPMLLTGLNAEAKDGFVRRGDRGQDILVKMPFDLYNAIKAEQRDARTRRARNAKLVREDLAQAAGATHGSEAGDFVHDDMSLTVKRGKPISLGDELDETGE